MYSYSAINILLITDQSTNVLLECIEVDQDFIYKMNILENGNCNASINKVVEI